MKYINVLVAMAVMFGVVACAGHGDYVENEKAAYWMKKYPGADQAKVNRCMAVANAEYDKSVGTNWGPTLMKANAWEKCMENK
jgi:hypothetical protein